MRLASFNVENLFDRPHLMNLGEWSDGKGLLDDWAALNALLLKPQYSTEDKAEMVRLLAAMGLDKADENKNFILRQNHGQLLKRGRGGVEIVAEGRASWIGWLDLKTEAVDEIAMRNTAQVIRDVNADILAVVEAESRTALSRFNATLLPAAKAVPYQHVMLIDGNDDRGIDVGILTRKGFPIVSMISHVDDAAANGTRIFSRDCPVYRLTTPRGATLHVAINHFKSKGYGSPAAANARRKAQAERVAAIYHDIIKVAPEALVAVVGDLNDYPDSAPLAPLAATNLKDVSAINGFDDGGHPGTYDSSGEHNKIDYILCSPKLFRAATAGGIWRKGMWGGAAPRSKWPMYPELTKKVHAASDHGAIWADFDI